MCVKHRVPMSRTANSHLGSFKCCKKLCRNKSQISRASGTWFENVKISLVHVFYLMYCFAHLKSYDEVIWEDIAKEKKCLSPNTIADWYNYCRETIILSHLGNVQENKSKIGGPGKIVQIDESKFGKRKYNKGRRVEGHWVIGMIADGSEDLRLEVCPNNIRSAEVLVPLIKKHVAEGSIVHTDFWKAYDCLGEHGYLHKKVNHSDPDNPFVGPDGVHTQRIESQWRAHT
ncbi:uncharacterized protein [Maniola hyperantus]|uniref:uncharacterized protein n=1 Tax=Aphantopus hyperantus TaxID=2795564 RepID=UPI003747BA01